MCLCVFTWTDASLLFHLMQTPAPATPSLITLGKTVHYVDALYSNLSICCFKCDHSVSRCLLDARITGSDSKFVSRPTENKLNFQLEAFRFQGADSGMVCIEAVDKSSLLQVFMSVHDEYPSPSVKHLDLHHLPLEGNICCLSP